MIGFYNHSVILTYISLISSVIGISFAIEGNILFAIICLMVSGCCDMFDGRIARAMKNRTDDEKSFGIQIDSLCDLVCFTVLPAIISYNIGPNKALGLVSGALLVLCGVIRLAYFNVMEIKQANQTPEGDHIYHGLPVTTTALLVPFIYLFKNLFGSYFPLFYQIALIVIAILFILDFTFKKPGKKGVIIMAIFGLALAIAAILLNI